MNGKNHYAKRSKGTSNSKTDLLEVHLFACGHGDAILIRIPGGRWVLIDCHLPKRGKHGDVQKRFFKFLSDKRVTRLDFVFQTHPHFDHFLGMRDVLKKYIDKKDGVGVYCDGGLNAQQIKKLLAAEKKLGADEYDRLYQSLREWTNLNKIQWKELDAERPVLSPLGLEGKIDFVPIGPAPEIRRQIVDNALEELAKNPNRVLEANALSIVVVLAVNWGRNRFNILFAADAPIDALERATKVWEQHTAEKCIEQTLFQVIKVSHHGSIASHNQNLCHLGAPGNRVAAISAGDREALPDKKVLAAFLKTDWIVMVTTKQAQLIKDSPGDLHFRGAMSKSSSLKHTIKLTWTKSGTFQYTPKKAIVTQADLKRFKRAKKTDV